jgi:hypothetical protein
VRDPVSKLIRSFKIPPDIEPILAFKGKTQRHREGVGTQFVVAGFSPRSGCGRTRAKARDYKLCSCSLSVSFNSLQFTIRFEY